MSTNSHLRINRVLGLGLEYVDMLLAKLLIVSGMSVGGSSQ